MAVAIKTGAYKLEYKVVKKRGDISANYLKKTTLWNEVFLAKLTIKYILPNCYDFNSYE